MKQAVGGHKKKWHYFSAQARYLEDTQHGLVTGHLTLECFMAFPISVFGPKLRLRLLQPELWVSKLTLLSRKFNFRLESERSWALPGLWLRYSKLLTARNLFWLAINSCTKPPREACMTQLYNIFLERLLNQYAHQNSPTAPF
jgi:hypothetical protein